MTDEKKPGAAPKRDTIPVRELTFGAKDPIDLPGKRVATSLRATPPELIFGKEGERINNVPAWTIDYVPGMGSFRVLHYPVEGKAVVTIFIEKTAVKTWEPLSA